MAVNTRLLERVKVGDYAAPGVTPALVGVARGARVGRVVIVEAPPPPPPEPPPPPIRSPLVLALENALLILRRDPAKVDEALILVDRERPVKELPPPEPEPIEEIVR